MSSSKKNKKQNTKVTEKKENIQSSEVSSFITFFSQNNRKQFSTGFLLLLFGLGFWFILPLVMNNSLDIPSEDMTEKALPSDALNNSKEEEINKETEERQEKTEGKIFGTLYVDFTCPGCKIFYKNTIASLHKEYSQDLDLNVRYYPKYNTGLSLEIAKFSYCAAQQKDEFEILDFFFFGKETIEHLEKDLWIKELELDPEKINTCLQTAGEKIIAEKKSAQAKGVRGTPTTFIGSTKFEGEGEKYILELEIEKQLQ